MFQNIALAWGLRFLANFLGGSPHQEQAPKTPSNKVSSYATLSRADNLRSKDGTKWGSLALLNLFVPLAMAFRRSGSPWTFHIQSLERLEEGAAENDVAGKHRWFRFRFHLDNGNIYTLLITRDGKDSPHGEGLSLREVSVNEAGTDYPMRPAGSTIESAPELTHGKIEFNVVDQGSVQSAGYKMVFYFGYDEKGGLHLTDTETGASSQVLLDKGHREIPARTISSTVTSLDRILRDGKRLRFTFPEAVDGIQVGLALAKPPPSAGARYQVTEVIGGIEKRSGEAIAEPGRWLVRWSDGQEAILNGLQLIPLSSAPKASTKPVKEGMDAKTRVLTARTRHLRGGERPGQIVPSRKPSPPAVPPVKPVKTRPAERASLLRAPTTMHSLLGPVLMRYQNHRVDTFLRDIGINADPTAEKIVDNLRRYFSSTQYDDLNDWILEAMGTYSFEVIGQVQVERRKLFWSYLIYEIVWEYFTVPPDQQRAEEQITRDVIQAAKQ
ncbi:MAG: hypothetical protein HY073_04615 [Deltaproteobacteria bacterium]|nr:hypothetical protein [Deltaproteobacteria bacterium]